MYIFGAFKLDSGNRILLRHEIRFTQILSRNVNCEHFREQKKMEQKQRTMKTVERPPGEITNEKVAENEI